jgi:threonine aldolase
MYWFTNDYSENACPEILDKLISTNFERDYAYSNDEHSRNAAKLIKEKIKRDDVEVQIMSGGTQTNLIAITAFLRPHEAVITTEKGHIFEHETGSVESTGHKCIAVSGKEGKIAPEDVRNVCGPQYWNNAGILQVKPKMVYISNSTELGTIYSANELYELRKVCNEYNLLFYMDGARLGMALACSDVSYEMLPEIFDAFYIGGTKNGALFGEALVIVNDSLKDDFRYIAKQRGGMLAKGWILGIQFEVLMTGNLYVKNGKHANEMAMILKKGLLDMDIPFAVDSPSNQQFPILPDNILERLKDNFTWEIIKKVDEHHTEIRLVTSWATEQESVYKLLNAIRIAKSGVSNE